MSKVLYNQNPENKNDYSKIENQIGCGWCSHEKTCTDRDPKINKAKQGCLRFNHYTNQTHP